MRAIIITVLILAVSLGGSAFAQCPGQAKKPSAAKAYLDDTECPAHKAAEMGASAFDDFHKIMAPAWHTAYPEKDYEALIAVGPGFADQYTKIAKLEPKFPNEHKAAYFGECRAEFGEIVAAYAAAAEKGNQEKVFEMMPALHTAFEKTAAALLPIRYKEFDGFKVTLDLIVRDHLPKENMEGVVGSTETLAAKAALLTVETLPSELVWSKEELAPRLERMRELTDEMKKCCDANDMAQYKEHAEALQAETDAFVKKYL